MSGTKQQSPQQVQTALMGVTQQVQTALMGVTQQHPVAQSALMGVTQQVDWRGGVRAMGGRSGGRIAGYCMTGDHTMAQRLRGAYLTNSGMHCLWNPHAFAGVRDYHTWEAELLEDDDILRHIEAGAFVPLNVQADGAYEIEVRVGSSDQPAVLSERETRFAVVGSAPYFFRSTGCLCASGIEHVEHAPGGSVGVLTLPEGDYAVTVFLIAWDDEPGMKREDGTPNEAALPDFVALLNPSSKDPATFRVNVETFQRPA